jgi:O-6-methylguanine DNA methyltransferase
MSTKNITTLQETWKDLFQKRLPAAAKAKDYGQPYWPVHVDHCFARIILDEVVGGGHEPWIGKLKTPAYKNMTPKQLEDSIQLGEQILCGEASLVELNKRSLTSRGKAVKKGKVTDKRKREGSGKVVANKKSKTKEVGEVGNDEDTRDDVNNGVELAAKKEEEVFDDGQDEARQDEHETETTQKTDIENEAAKTKTRDKNGTSNGSISDYFARKPSNEKTTSNNALNNQETAALLQKILDSNKTNFQKRVLSLLIQIPPGHYSTYSHLATYLNSSPRAVGNALRNNPFAPEVPCHRVLATGGGIGGFGGSWGKGGKAGENDAEKRRLLNAEGVKFDGKGKAVRGAWDGFA